MIAARPRGAWARRLESRPGRDRAPARPPARTTHVRAGNPLIILFTARRPFKSAFPDMRIFLHTRTDSARAAGAGGRAVLLDHFAHEDFLRDQRTGLA
ncbi:hypothetical protein EVAR_89762_1 [Eumeta japonica]|uniref:Uncharacterized protein n=1 Tax=Eumeta variegata TaxID=151549 RepID=A0A4C1XB87_EUMVA|nr:hypothetical protein EVAR_89762_1 [Eumeta japonica]